MQNRPMSLARMAAIVAAVFVAFIVVMLLTFSAFKAWHRYQKRADARNSVKVTTILIRKAQQQARVVRAQNAAVNARAQQRFLEAVGIRRAQDEISKTLTQFYLQHEAIQAQERIAESGKNNTIIYSPAGSNGVPLVQTPPTNTGTAQNGGK
jgi:hypothetical protein